MREAGVSAIEAHGKVRSRRINFSVLLLPQEKAGKTKLIHKSSHNLTTRGFEDVLCSRCSMFSILLHQLYLFHLHRILHMDLNTCSSFLFS